MASVPQMQEGMQAFRPVAEHIKEQRRLEDEEFTRRTGIRYVRRRRNHALYITRSVLRTIAPILASYDIDGLLQLHAENQADPEYKDADTRPIKSYMPLRRSARIAQIQQRKDVVALQARSKPSRNQPAPKRPRGRPPEKEKAPREKISRGTACSRGGPRTRRSLQAENLDSQGGITKKRGRPRKISR